jgi:peptidoglycan/LPS O-acetylase OafA/YrhL
MNRARSGRILEIDGLRGIAIFLVLLWHYVVVMTQASHGSLLAYGLAPLRLTWSGVDLFFVLSGFLIGGILLDARRSGTYFATFYRRRFFRIVPVYATFFVLFLVAVCCGGEHWRGSAGRWLFTHPLPWYSFPLFLQNVFVAYRGSFDPLSTSVTWSLAVEEQFYLTLPLLVRILSPRRLFQVLATTAAAAPVLRTMAFYCLPHGGIVAYVLTPMRADSLLIGVLSAMLVRSPRALAAFECRRRLFKFVVGILAAAALCAIPLGCANFTSAVLSTVGYSWLALLYALVLLLAVSGPPGRLSRFLRTRWLRSLGQVAYGTYLMHVTVLGVCFGLVLGHDPRIASLAELGVTVLAVAVTLAVASISWTFFEKRMVRIGQRQSYSEPTNSTAG